MEKQAYTPQEAAIYLGVAVKTLADWRWRARRGDGNRGPAFTKMGGKVIYRKVALDRHIMINETDSDAGGKKTK